MIIVKVTYTAKEEFSLQNQNNIKKVMSDLRDANHSGINYNACICADKRTFIHTAFFKSEEDRNILNELPSFRVFQEQLKANGLESAPKQELLELVGSSSEIF